MGFNYLKATATSRRQFTYYHSVPRNSWYSFYRPRMDETLSRPSSHPVVLNTGTLDWEYNALTTRPPIKTDSLKIKIHIIVNYRNDKLRILYCRSYGITSTATAIFCFICFYLLFSCRVNLSSLAWKSRNLKKQLHLILAYTYY